MTTTDTEPTTTSTIPRPGGGGDPTWCAFRGLEHEWDQDFDGTWTRMHEHAVGRFSVAQLERFTTDGRTFDAPSGNTSLSTFNSAKDARAFASDLVQIARTFEQIENGPTTTWPTSTEVSEAVKSAIKAAGLNQREIATATGIATSTLSRRFTGRGRPFLVNELFDIATVIGVDVSALLRAAEDGAR